MRVCVSLHFFPMILEKQFFVFMVLCFLPRLLWIWGHLYRVYNICVIMVSSALCRSSHRKCSIKKGVLRNLTKFTGKHLCQSLFFNKAAGLRRCFPVNFVKFLRTPFLQNTSRRLLLSVSCSHFIKTTCKNMKILLYKNTLCKRFWVFKKQYSHKMKHCIKCNQK